MQLVDLRQQGLPLIEGHLLVPNHDPRLVVRLSDRYGRGQVHLIREELVKRRIQQPNGHREAIHGLEDPHEVVALEREQRLVGLLLLFRRVREDHLANRRDSLLSQEHVLGATEADPLGSSLPGVGGLLGGIRVGAHPEPPAIVGLGHQAVEGLPDLLLLGLAVAASSLLQRRRLEGEFADVHSPVETVDRDDVSFGDLGPVGCEFSGADVDSDRVGAAHRRDPLPSRHNRRVRIRSAGRREDPLGSDHPVVVVRSGLAAHQDHLLAAAGPLLRIVRAEHHLPDRCARRGIQPIGQGRLLGLGVLLDDVLEQLDQPVGIDAEEGFGGVDEPLLEHVVRHDPFGERSPLPHAGLQDPKRPLFDGELDVAHVAVVLPQGVHGLSELAVGLRIQLLQLRQGQGVADAGDHVLALGVREVVAVGNLLPR